MNANQALAQARRRWGTTAAVQDRKYETSPELRAKAKAEFQRIKALPVKEQEALRKEKLQARSGQWRYRYSVGKLDSVCGMGMFLVEAEGDTWDECFAKAAERKKAA